MKKVTWLSALALAGAGLVTYAVAEDKTAAADSDESVTVSCPASGYGTPVVVENDVSSPGDGRDVINYTLEVPSKADRNTGRWEFKARIKCIEGKGITFTAGTRTDRCGGNGQIIDNIVVPTTNKTGKITIQSTQPSPQQAPVYTKYSVTFNCNIHRPN